MNLLDEVLPASPVERERLLAQRGVSQATRRCLDRLLQSAGDDDELTAIECTIADVLGEAEENLVPDLRGRRFGDFLVESPLGRGGMSVVCRARRTQGAIEQVAAVKLLPLGRLSRPALDRFRQEQVILAQLRHPNITTFLDGGVTEDGTPWIAMELVEGRAVDEHVHANALEAGAIVRLVLTVCRAVEHAHRNLVVHRDLKPSNVLVDDDGQVHLLDFGVARLLEDASPGGRATATIAVTPDYAAPEQLAGRPATTAVDVFGLGALLFRLLTGRAPYPPGRLSPFDPRRFEELALPRKGPEPIDRDLAFVLRRSLHPDPELRYASAADLASDLERWLDGRPVEAGPDRAGYRLRKLLARHRTAAAAAFLALLSLAGGVATTAWQARRAARSASQASLEAERARRQAARAEEVTRFLVDTFGAADPLATSGEEVTAREIVDRAAQRIDEELQSAPETRHRLLTTLGDVSYNLGDFGRSAELLEQALAIPEVPPEGRAHAYRTLGMAKFMRGEAEESEASYREGLRLVEGMEAQAELRVHLAVGLAQTLVDGGRPDEARELLETTLAAEWLDAAAAREELVAHLSQQLARALAAAGRYEEAFEPARRAVNGLSPDAGGRERADYASALRTLADVHTELGNLDAAEAAERESLEIFRRTYGDSHSKTLTALNNLATLSKARGRFAESARILETVAERQEQLFGEEHSYLAVTLGNLGEAYYYDGRLERARRAYARAASMADATAQPGDPNPAIFQALHARVLGKLGRTREATSGFESSLTRLRGTVGREHPLTARIAVIWSALLNDLGRHRRAHELAARSLPILEQTYPAGSARTALARLELGRALLATGVSQRARDLLQQALEAFEESPRRRQYTAEIALTRSLLNHDSQS